MKLAINFQDLYVELRRTGFRFGGGPPDDRLSITIGTFISVLVPYLFVIAGLLMLLYIIYGGFLLLTSGGDPKAVSAAKEKVTFAIVGFIVVFVSFWLVQIIGRMFGIQPIIDIFG